MKYYCTKYWATRGIIEFEGEISKSSSNEAITYVRTKASNSKWYIFERLGVHAFTTLEEAQLDVEKKAQFNLLSKEKAVVKAKKLLVEAAARKIKVVA